ncbi:MAG: VanZ family protein, partial [Oscillospiraceae bacterium]|nr:VanZ family protein [Oscillospiraceae bacterium]
MVWMIMEWIKHAVIALMSFLACFALLSLAVKRGEILDRIKQSAICGYCISLESFLLFSDIPGAPNIFPFEFVIDMLCSEDRAVFIHCFLKALGFVPLSLMLCGFRKTDLKKLLLATLTLCFVNELIQHVFSFGRANIDDLILGLFGSFVGWWVYSFYKALKTKENTGAYFTAMFSTVVIFTGLAALYLGKPYGFLPCDLANRCGIKPLSADCSLLEADLEQYHMVYKLENSYSSGGAERCKSVLESFDIQFDAKRAGPYDNMSLYWSDSSGASLWYWNDGSFELNIPGGIELAEKEQIKSLLENLGNEIPDNSKIQELSKGRYSVGCEMEEWNGFIYNGYISFEYLGEKLYYLSFQMKKLSRVEEYNGLTVKELEENLLKGKFTAKDIDYKLGDIKALNCSV